MKDREYILNLLSKAEQEFPVYEWQIAGVDIWPLLKTQLFFDFYNEHLNKKTKDLTFYKNKISAKIRQTISKINKRSQVKEVSSNFSQNDILFLGPLTARVETDKGNVNRFFDPLMDSLGYSSHLIEYMDIETDKLYKSNRITNVTHLYKEIKKNYIYQDFDFQQLNQFDDFLNYSNLISKKNDVLTNLKVWINETILWSKVGDFCIDKIKPKTSIGLSYYSIQMFGFIRSAKKAQIPFVDMQHGGLGPSHPLYNFQNLPQSPYPNSLPDFFWAWDDSSSDFLTQIFSPNRVINGGNTWIQYCEKNKDTKKLSDKKIILYTLQDGEYFPSKIVEAIKESKNEYQWWVRMHPRTSKTEVERIKNGIKINQIGNLIEFEKANTLSLPEILQNASVHVSSYSGSIVEAALVGVPCNITISEIGKNNYKNLIDAKQLNYYDLNSDLSFLEFMKSLLVNSNAPKKNSDSYQYDEIINQLLSNYKKFLSTNLNE